MSSSEPRLNRLTAGNPQLPAGNVNPLKSTVPHSTHIVVIGVMLIFFVGATLFTLQAAWPWWLIVVAIAIPVVIVLTERYRRVSRERAELRSAMNGLPGRGAGSDR